MLDFSWHICWYLFASTIVVCLCYDIMSGTHMTYSQWLLLVSHIAATTWHTNNHWLSSPWEAWYLCRNLLLSVLAHSSGMKDVFMHAHVWQSQGEIEHYCIEYFECVTMSEALNFCWGLGSYPLHRHVNYSCIYAVRISPALNKVLHYSTSNVVMWSKFTTE